VVEIDAAARLTQQDGLGRISRDDGRRVNRVSMELSIELAASEFVFFFKLVLNE